MALSFAAVSFGEEADVLVALARSTGHKTGRKLSRLSGRSVTRVQHGLDRLVDEGLVHRAKAGRSFLYTLNRERGKGGWKFPSDIDLLVLGRDGINSRGCPCASG